MSIAMEEGPRRHRITVDEYHRMAEVGLLAPDARVELIEGEIIDMPPIGIRHMANVDRLTHLFCNAVGDRAIVRCQGGVQLSDITEPQPDFALLAPREDFYESRRATVADALLVVEVSDTTLKYDLNRKMSLYARHGVREFWVLDVNDKRLHVFAGPTDTGYERRSAVENPVVMGIGELPGVTVDLSSLFRGA